jgi:tripartite-type tricarboxylate transporter receptor subunit TctC
MRDFLIAALLLACGQTAAATRIPEPVELVHPFPPTGPVEIAGTVAANKVLRTVQRYSAPAFSDILAMHVAQTLQGESDPPSLVTRKPRQGGHDAAVYVSSAAADGRTLLLASEIPAAKAGSRADRALRPVALVASMPFVLIASSESKHASLQDFDTRSANDTGWIAHRQRGREERRTRRD